MKKILLAAVACCVMGAPSMFGSSVYSTCTNFGGTYANGAGSLTDSCSGFSQAGTTLNSVEIWYVSDFQFGGSPTNTVNIVFTPSNSLDTWTPSSTTCTISGAGTANTDTCGFYSGTLTSPGTTEVSANGAGIAALAASGFTVNAISSVTAGSVSNSSSGVIVEYDYTTNAGSAPEPGSMILLGSGLVAAGLLGRKKLFVRK
jgi:hypothetical protein